MAMLPHILSFIIRVQFRSPTTTVSAGISLLTVIVAITFFNLHSRRLGLLK